MEIDNDLQLTIVIEDYLDGNLKEKDLSDFEEKLKFDKKLLNEVSLHRRIRETFFDMHVRNELNLKLSLIIKRNVIKKELEDSLIKMENLINDETTDSELIIEFINFKTKYNNYFKIQKHARKMTYFLINSDLSYYSMKMTDSENEIDKKIFEGIIKYLKIFKKKFIKIL